MIYIVQSKIYLQKLKDNKKRISPGRRQIIDLFCAASFPLTATFLIKKTKLNKTSVYRELKFLLSQEIITEFDFADGMARYELKDLNHHHHLICMKCKKICDLTINDKFEIPTFLRKIQNEKGFTVLKHNLEFFGYCQNCNK